MGSAAGGCRPGREPATWPTAPSPWPPGGPRRHRPTTSSPPRPTATGSTPPCRAASVKRHGSLARTRAGPRGPTMSSSGWSATPSPWAATPGARPSSAGSIWRGPTTRGRGSSPAACGSTAGARATPCAMSSCWRPASPASTPRRRTTPARCRPAASACATRSRRSSGCAARPMPVSARRPSTSCTGRSGSATTSPKPIPGCGPKN